MHEALEKFKEMLGTVQTVAVRTGDTHNASKILAGAVLHSFFRSTGKRSQFEFSPVTEEIQRALFLTLKNLENDSLNSRVIVSVSKQGSPVALEYEKTEDHISIIMESAGPLSGKDITVREGGVRADLLMLIDPEDRYIDTLCESIPHREVVKVSSKNRPLSLKVSDIILSISKSPSIEIATTLWLLLSVDYVTDEHLAEVAAVQKNLETIGIDRGNAEEARAILRGKTFWKITGRALARTEYEPSIKTIWSFLPKKDFEKTNHPHTNVPHIFYELKKLRPEGSFHAFLWERAGTEENKDGKVSSIIAAKNRDHLAIIADALEARIEGEHCIVDTFKSFSEAETKIRSSIQRAIS